MHGACLFTHPDSKHFTHRAIMRTNDTQFRHTLESAARPLTQPFADIPTPPVPLPSSQARFSDEHPMSR